MKEVEEYIVNVCNNQSKMRFSKKSARSVSGYLEEMKDM